MPKILDGIRIRLQNLFPQQETAELPCSLVETAGTFYMLQACMQGNLL